MQKVIITGATSFVGFKLTEKLLYHSIETHVIKRPSSNLSVFLNLPKKPTFHDYDGTVQSLEIAFRLSGADTVFHIAGKYERNDSSESIDKLIDSNIRFSTHIMHTMAHMGSLQHLINVGSYFQYLDGLEPRAVNLYAAMKTANTELVRYYCDAYGLNAITLVIFDTYGVGEWRSKLMSALCDAVINKTPVLIPADDLTLDFVYIDDVVNAFIHAAELLETTNNYFAGQSYALSSGVPTKISELIQLYEEVSQSDLNIKKGEWPQQERMIKNLWPGPILPGWTPKVSINEGIRRLIEVANKN